MLKNKIFTNTFINFAGKLFSYTLQLVIITYLLNSLGKDVYGIVVLALALAANTNILEAGFGLSVTKYIAEYNATSQWNKLHEVVNTNFIITAIFALLFCCILVPLNELFLHKIFTIPPERLNDAKALIRILIVLSIVDFFSASIVRIAEGFQKFMLVRGIEVMKWTLRAALIIFFMHHMGHGLIGVGIAYFIAGIISLIMLIFFVLIRNTDLQFSLRYCSRAAFNNIFGFSIWIFLAKFFAFLSYRIDTMLIGIFLSPVYLTYYNIAFKVYELLRFGISLCSSTLVPVSSELHAVMEKSKLSFLFQKASRYTVLTIYPILIVSFIHADMIINYWVGAGFDTSVTLSRLFIVSLFLTALISSGTEMMVGLNRLKELVFHTGIGAFINLTVSIILIIKLGVSGVVIGTLIGSCVIVTGYLYQILLNFDMTFKHFAKNIIGKPVISSFLFGIGFFMLSDKLYFGIAGTIFYYYFLVNYLIDKDDKELFIKILLQK